MHREARLGRGELRLGPVAIVAPMIAARHALALKFVELRERGLEQLPPAIDRVGGVARRVAHCPAKVALIEREVERGVVELQSASSACSGRTLPNISIAASIRSCNEYSTALNRSSSLSSRWCASTSRKRWYWWKPRSGSCASGRAGVRAFTSGQ
ncbi:MAG: hypothetical protein U1E76_20920 [Planctomycetota bacterium]